jgi:putative restriction endonuclease
MNYWWVNQNQTHKQEIPGGYLWSPKTKKDGHRNPFYENMTKVRPGDFVFSYYKQRISHIGIAKSTGYTHSKPDFGASGDRWLTDGWMVNVSFRPLQSPFIPKKHIQELLPHFPPKYAPLKASGDGKEFYLTGVPEPLARAILQLLEGDISAIRSESDDTVSIPVDDTEAEANRVEKIIHKDSTISETEKETLIKARKGQGDFRDDVIDVFKSCPFTGISNERFLIAGHLKPWAKCSNNKERLDPLNGLPLSPVADRLVDRGWATFNDDGTVLFSPKMSLDDLRKMGIDPFVKYQIPIHDARQLDYIAYHRDKIFIS